MLRTLILTVALVAASGAHASPAVFPGEAPPVAQPIMASPELQEADQRLNSGDIAGARAAYLKVIDQAPSSPAAAQALSGVANTYVFERNYRGAVEYLEAVITRGTDQAMVKNARVAYTKISTNVDQAARRAQQAYTESKASYEDISWWNIFKIFEKFRLRTTMKNAQKDLDQVLDVKLMFNPVYLVLDVPTIDPGIGNGSSGGSTGGAIDPGGAGTGSGGAGTGAGNANNANSANANAGTGGGTTANTNTSNANTSTGTGSGGAGTGAGADTANGNTANANDTTTNTNAVNTNTTANANTATNANNSNTGSGGTAGSGGDTGYDDEPAQASNTAAATAAAERAKAVLVLEGELSRILALVPPDKRDEARKIIVAGGGYQPAQEAVNPSAPTTTTSSPSAPVTTGTTSAPSVDPVPATTSTTAPTPNVEPSTPPPPASTAAVPSDGLDALQQRVVESYRALQDRLKAGDRDGQARAQNDYMMATMALRTKMAFMANVRPVGPAQPVTRPSPSPSPAASAAPSAPASTSTTPAASSIRVPPVVPLSPAAPGDSGTTAAPAAPSAPANGATPVNPGVSSNGGPISDDAMRGMRGGLRPR